MAQHEGRVAIVTGGGAGIGGAIARKLAAGGASVCIAERDEATGKAMAAELGDAAVFVQTDVGENAPVEAMIARTIKRFGKIDILINNVSSGAVGKVTEVAEDDWLRAMNLTLHSVYRVSRFAIPHLIKCGSSAIVNIASNAGLAGNYNMGCYAAAKAGVINLTRSMALDHVKDGLRVNAVCPGLIETPATSRIKPNETYWNAYIEGIPMRRAGQPAEIANAVSFLASAEASYITGTTLIVDGGKTAWSGQPNSSDFLSAAS